MWISISLRDRLSHLTSTAESLPARPVTFSFYSTPKYNSISRVKVFFYYIYCSIYFVCKFVWAPEAWCRCEGHRTIDKNCLVMSSVSHGHLTRTVGCEEQHLLFESSHQPNPSTLWWVCTPRASQSQYYCILKQVMLDVGCGFTLCAPV